MTQPFHPAHIYIDSAVAELPHTKSILTRFPNTPRTILEDVKNLKKEAPMTWAKKGLILTRFKADWPLKLFGAMEKSAGRPVFSLNLISNCHLECTYCILQSYLSNNPVITIYTNLQEILEKLSKQLSMLAPNTLIGTGKIADSLALEEITGYAKELVLFFAEHPGDTQLEFKTKSDCVDSLIGLDHKQKTVVSWSINPPNIIDAHEWKTASLEARLHAAKRCVDAGYPVAFHIDPVIWHEGWEKNYTDLIRELKQKIPAENIRWISIGALRFPSRQQKIITERFPKAISILEHLQHTHLPFLTYPEEMRQQIYGHLEKELARAFPNPSTYICMEEE